MTNQPRTPTPEIDQIWSRTATRHRWHQLWIDHINDQTGANPNHPAIAGMDAVAYQQHTNRYAEDDNYAADWDLEVDDEEHTTRHDLVAELNVFNRRAGRTTAHLGLTSHDIVDHANQQAILASVRQILNQTEGILHQLAGRATQYRDLLILERTHGQPAQASLYGLRIATIIDPLWAWHNRTNRYVTASNGYRLKPPYGAVGTGADISRILDSGWGRIPVPTHAAKQLSNYADQVVFRDRALATRQTYHRSYDLHIAGLMLELASIAQTWAYDRRLEALTGLGGEQRDHGQIGSSAMPHKANPVLCERMVSLCGTIAGYHEMAARAASTEWLGGDVSGSNTRRTWLPQIFQAASALLINWETADSRWTVEIDAINDELDRYGFEICAGIYLQQLVEKGLARADAHRALAETSGHPTMVRSGTKWYELARPVINIDRLGLRPAQAIIDQVVDLVCQM